jgi:signal peptidase I
MRKKILILSLALFSLALTAVPAYYFLFLRLVRVPTGAMANTILPGDQLVVRKRAIGEIGRGDIVIFEFPKNPSEQYVFRIVGLPGEAIEIRDRVVYIDGKELPEERVWVKPAYGSQLSVLEELSSEGHGPYRVFYYSRGPKTEPLLPTQAAEDEFGTNGPFRIPTRHYFVLGDNRDNSYDSRFWGPVKREAILGKPTTIYWSSQVDGSGEELPRWERVFRKLR